MAEIGKVKKSATAKAVPKRVKIGEKNYTKVSCSKKKSDAKKKAEKIRSEGKLARIKEDKKNGTYCVLIAKKAAKPKEKVKSIFKKTA